MCRGAHRQAGPPMGSFQAVFRLVGMVGIAFDGCEMHLSSSPPVTQAPAGSSLLKQLLCPAFLLSSASRCSVCYFRNVYDDEIIHAIQVIELLRC